MIVTGRRASFRWSPGAKRAQGGMVAALLLAGCASVDPLLDDEVPVVPAVVTEPARPGFEDLPEARCARHAGPADTARSMSGGGVRDASIQRRYRATLRAELAQAYLEQGVPAVAAEEARAALMLDPVNRDAAHLLALLAAQDGAFAEADACFQRALAAPGAAGDRVLRENYVRFSCERFGRRPSVSGCPNAAAGGDESKSDVSGLHLLRAQSIAMDNSPASGTNRQNLQYGHTGQSRSAAGGLGHRRIRQENSSEESRDE
jgi:hypothetical protein